MITRAQIQERIDILISENPDIDLVSLETQLGDWLNHQQLGYEGMTDSFIRDRILDDLSSYQGVLK